MVCSRLGNLGCHIISGFQSHLMIRGIWGYTRYKVECRGLRVACWSLCQLALSTTPRYLYAYQETGKCRTYGKKCTAHDVNGNFWRFSRHLQRMDATYAKVVFSAFSLKFGKLLVFHIKIYRVQKTVECIAMCHAEKAFQNVGKSKLVDTWSN